MPALLLGDPLYGWLGCIVMVCSFVGIFYVAEPKRVVALDRNHPDKILFRFKVTGLIGAVSVGIVALFHDFEPKMENSPTLLQLLGIRNEGILTAMGASLLTTVALFFGPLYERSLQFNWSEELSRGNVARTLKNFLLYNTHPQDTLVIVRNLWMAPLAEELVFRCCMGSLLWTCGVGRTTIIFLSPLLFGLAHVHHAVASVMRGEMSAVAAAQKAVFQSIYTSLFGFYAAFVFLRTGHMLAPLLSHCFCNSMGFPSFAWTGSNYEFPSQYYAIRRAFIVGIILFTAGVIGMANDPCALFRSSLWIRGD